MKIALVMAHGRVHQHVGGAPKIFFEMANEFSNYHEVLAIYSDNGAGEPLYQTQPNVKLVNLHVDKSVVRTKKAKVVREIVRGLNKTGIVKLNYDPVTSNQQTLIGLALKPELESFEPDVIISFGHWDLVSISDFYSGNAKIISSYHSDTNRFFPQLSKRELNAHLRADLCQVLLKSYCSIVSEKMNGRCEVIDIGNPINDFSGNANLSEKNIIYMARIEKNKQQDKLLSCFANIPSDLRVGWKIKLYGSDASLTYKSSLLALVKELGISDCVEFKGVTSDPEQALKQASICAFPSLFEGFPLALSEAMSAGLPCVGYESCSGVNEIITHENDGFLARDDSEFSLYLSKLMASESLRSNMGKRAYHKISHYHPNVIWSIWAGVLKKYIPPMKENKIGK
ncbi:glycosyltransferase [Vibrio vulnificus]|uniref:glycosyltransferase n=1 Tax=Vibrio vulnificus TaxID=672 RepID=UPI001028C1B3|nr:glycosyltransferase [Vibrio vulnificus]EGR0753043.1 glycosyltransferase [Vibrio vulnificus]EHZ2847408.1 glycosyltransferase [Vibrio vulnificus]RZP95129.1 glycosyltransferase [Vibrio vulnificus]